MAIRLVATLALFVSAGNATDDVETALARSGANRLQLQRAIELVSATQRDGLLFLLHNMPDRDLESLTAEFLLENTDFAYRALAESPWKDRMPIDVFLNDVLPYASINERRDPWRRDFYERFRPLVKDARSPSQAAALLNRSIYSALKVRYSTQRAKADQSPYESIESGLASCTGLSVLLIDACRAVAVPARFVGTPRWSDQSGNHSWVEVWDDGWHFTGAAEPTGDALDQAWFVARASQAQRDHPLHAIYATSFRRTPLHFPLVWARGEKWIPAVNVTERYLGSAEAVPDGKVRVLLRVLDRPSGDRVAANVQIRDAHGDLVLEGISKDERFDRNDHLGAILPQTGEFRVGAKLGSRAVESKIRPAEQTAPVTLILPDDSRQVVERLERYLSQDPGTRPAISEQPFASVALTREAADRAATLLWNDHVNSIRKSRAAEMKDRRLTDGMLQMPFHYEVFGEKPPTGRTLVFSMHGGGGAPKRVNDQQWENQKRLYRLEEGVYVVPRAPTDTWDLWHQSHIDRMFDRLIENLVAFEDVDPDRVFLMGYSAGGDGVYQLTPRMADRWAAAAMMAGHPNETSALGLRNVPFTIHVGGRDAAYNRNVVAQEWQRNLAELHQADPGGYRHLVKIYPEKGHWMDKEDAAAIPWMMQFRRIAAPDRIVWKQDDVRHDQFYWLAVDSSTLRDRATITAERKGQTIDLCSDDADRITVRFNDELMDLDRLVEITSAGRRLYQGAASRTIGLLAKTLHERRDQRLLYSAEVTVDLRTK